MATPVASQSLYRSVHYSAVKKQDF